MSRLTRFARSLAEVKDLTPGGHPSLIADPWWFRVQRTVDLNEVGDGSQNSAVLATLRVLAHGFQEAEMSVAERIEGTWETIPDQPFTDLWLTPNGFMDDAALIWYLTWSTRVDGNGYLVKVRNTFGDVIEIWPLLPHLVQPRTFDEGRGATPSFIDYYEYMPHGSPARIPPEDMIHIKYGLDPQNHRKGLAPLKAVLREVASDEEASQFSAALLANNAVGGTVLVPAEPGDPGPTQEQADDIKERFNSEFGRRRRGSTVVLTGQMRVERMSFSPEELDLRNLRRVPEERITAVLGVPAILAHLGAGLDRSTLNNVREAGELFTERTLVPGWRNWERQIYRQTRDDYGFTQMLRPRFDTSDVRALSEDVDALYERMTKAVQGGWATVADARRAGGLAVEDHHDVFIRSVNSEEVPNSDDPQEPALTELERLVTAET